MTGRESSRQTGMRGRGGGYVQERATDEASGGARSAEGTRRGCDMTENQTACLRRPHPTTQSGFEVETLPCASNAAFP